MLGIIVDNIIDNSYYYSMFKNLNVLADSGCSCYVFANSTVSLPIENRFTILQQLESFNHKGTLIATSIINVQTLKKNLTAKKKYYYVWQPEWVSLNQFTHNNVSVIYNNPEIDLLCRSQSHKKLLTSLFKEPKAVVFNWNHRDLGDII